MRSYGSCLGMVVIALQEDVPSQERVPKLGSLFFLEKEARSFFLGNISVMDSFKAGINKDAVVTHSSL